MCQIFHLKPHAEVPHDKMLHSILNNPHGWGSVLKRDDKLEVRREVRLKNDPDKIMKWLEQNEEEERFIHLRWRTRGDINKENCHPFEVFRKGSRRILVMHNGTLAGFEPPKDSRTSDTKIFCENFLKPLLKNYHVNGEAGIIDDMLMNWIARNVDARSRVLLIPSDQPVIYFNKFNEENDQGWCSANTYSFTPDYRKPTIQQSINRSYSFSTLLRFAECSKRLKLVVPWFPASVDKLLPPKKGEIIQLPLDSM